MRTIQSVILAVLSAAPRLLRVLSTDPFARVVAKNGFLTLGIIVWLHSYNCSN